MMDMTLSSMGYGTMLVLVTADMYLHAPAHYLLKHIAMILSLIAAVSPQINLALIAQVVWAISIATSEAAPDKILAEVELETTADDNDVPSQAKMMVDESLKLFLKNLDSSSNCDGKPWKSASETEGIKVYSSELAGQSTKRWKVETVVKAPSVEALVEELFNFDKRASGSGGWDSAVKSGRIEKTWGDYSISVMATNAAAGGAISSREFVDVRVKVPDHPAVSKGGLLIASIGIEPKTDKWCAPFPKLDKNATLGRNFSGGGVKIEPTGEPNTFNYTMVNNLNLKGWIPTSVINSATADALVESHKAMHKHLKSKFDL